MNPSELLAYLSSVVANDIRTSLMIWGAPGVGKSSIVAQAALQSGLECVDVRVSQLAPTDLRGLPVPERLEQGGGISRWYPPEFLPRDGAGILFLDELNMAAPSMQGVAQQLILDRRVGNYQLPYGWFVWAAGNRKEDRASVFDMPTALANRFAHIEISPDVASFKSYAIAHGVSEHIISFLSFRPELLHRVDPTQPAWPSPRSWFMADRLLKAGMSADSAVGAAVSAELSAFTKLYKKLPNVEVILEGNGEKVPCPTELSVKYATTISLALRARSGEHAVNSFRWMTSKMTTEWTRTFIHDLRQSMLSKGLQGPLAVALLAEPSFKSFVEDYHELQVTT